MRLYYVSTDNIGVNQRAITFDVRKETRKAGDVVVIKLFGNDPAGDGEIEMSENEATTLRDHLDKLFPKLRAVPHSGK